LISAPSSFGRSSLVIYGTSLRFLKPFALTIREQLKVFMSSKP
jgi:hypothetical protein